MKPRTKPKFHPLAVRAVLVRAGLHQSEWLASSRVRGWGNHTEGFRIETTYGTTRGWRSNRRRRVPGEPRGWSTVIKDTKDVKAIKVTWNGGSWFTGDEDSRKRCEINALLTYADALREAGFEVTSDNEHITIVWTQ